MASGASNRRMNGSRPATPSVLVALTGGIGAGKSSVARLLVDHGGRLIDADELARSVVDPETAVGSRVLRSILAEFGTELLNPDGTLDRRRTAELIFVDENRRRTYNSIVHPALLAMTATAIDAELASGGIVVHEIPLLTADTPPLPWRYNFVVTVEAPIEERIRRLVEGRGYTVEHARARIHAQGSIQARLAVADEVIRNDGDLEMAAREVDALWHRLTLHLP
jgi:dephospho-CoA kinase